MAIYNVSVRDEVISLDRRYSHAKSIISKQKIPVPWCLLSTKLRKCTKWKNLRALTKVRFSSQLLLEPQTPLHTSKKNGAYHRRKISSSEMLTIKRDVAWPELNLDSNWWKVTMCQDHGIHQTWYCELSLKSKFKRVLRNWGIREYV